VVHSAYLHSHWHNEGFLPHARPLGWRKRLCAGFNLSTYNDEGDGCHGVAENNMGGITVVLWWDNGEMMRAWLRYCDSDLAVAGWWNY
jgi:hypothetical protein